MDRALISIVQEGVSLNVNIEFSLFLEAVFSGMVLVAVYDIIRIFRRIKKHGVIWVSIEDFIYWIFCGIVLFGIVLKENGGIFRCFFVIGVILGALLFYFGISRYLVEIVAKIINKILDIVKKGLKIIYSPIRKMVIFLAKRVKGMYRKTHKHVLERKKTLKKEEK